MTRWIVAACVGLLLTGCCDRDDDDDKFYWSFNTDNGSGHGSHLTPDRSTSPVIHLQERNGIARRDLRLTLTLELAPETELGPIAEIGAFCDVEEIPSQLHLLDDHRLEIDIECDLPAHGTLRITLKKGRRWPIERAWSPDERTLGHDEAGVTIAPFLPIRLESWRWHGRNRDLVSASGTFERLPLWMTVTRSGPLRRALRIESPDGFATELHLDWRRSRVWRRVAIDQRLDRVPVGIAITLDGARRLRGAGFEIAWDLERLGRRP